ncbi:MAG: Nif3-like dinuclear metal center hexameric protein [Gammaproteobacteria bacterium]|nr:Nif3-like dinuclear metal center hexameric protein [Gammaproteobacteria bacterium]
MIERDQLVSYLNQLLEVGKFQDYCPNGLQVEGKSAIRKIVTGVTACQALLDKAVELKADAVLVHHGYFWKNEAPQVVGLKHNRLKTLLTHDINLLAYHLPLDAHPELGNNGQLAKILEIDAIGPFSENDQARGLYGRLKQAMSVEELSQFIAKKLNRQPLMIAGAKSKIETIAWCTGGAQSLIDQAHLKGVDAYLSGEVSESTYHFAKEMGIAYIGAGHHATERYGVKALSEHLAEKFDVKCQFIDIDNPV